MGLPVLRVKKPVQVDETAIEMAKGRRYMPDLRGVAPRTDWKYSGR